jgi:hypothetical protein
MKAKPNWPGQIPNIVHVLPIFSKYSSLFLPVYLAHGELAWLASQGPGQGKILDGTKI